MILSYGLWAEGKVAEEVLLARILKAVRVCKCKITKTKYVYNPADFSDPYSDKAFSSMKIYYKERDAK